MCHFRVPNRIITDNGSQFTSGAFTSYCDELGIKVFFASIVHPRSNGQVERANAEVLRGLKTKTFDRFETSGKKWIEELPSVLWSLRTTPQGNRRVTVLPRLRGKSGSPHGTHVRVSPGAGL